MCAGKGYILVEGHGEIEAVHNLITRLSNDIDLYLPWSNPIRWKNLHMWEARGGGLLKGINFIRSKSDVSALLILRDEDDGCPKEIAPRVSSQISQLNLLFPVAYILFYPEYEVLFLPCLERMGFPSWDGESWESRRGIKEWLSKQLPRGKSYKPTTDQLILTRKIDFSLLREFGPSCFWTLERSLSFIKHELESGIKVEGRVYPPGE